MNIGTYFFLDFRGSVPIFCELHFNRHPFALNNKIGLKGFFAYWTSLFFFCIRDSYGCQYGLNSILNFFLSTGRIFNKMGS